MRAEISTYCASSLQEAQEQKNNYQENPGRSTIQVLTRNGNIYLPASLLASEFGYATDHVARIARQNKVSAFYENKRWYITRESLIKYRDQAKQNKVLGGLKSTKALVFPSRL